MLVSFSRSRAGDDATSAQRGHLADDSRHGPGRARAGFGDAEAVVDGDRRVAVRRRSPRWSTAAARALLASGIERGDRVAVWAPNSLEWIVAALGVTTAGGVLVPVNTRFRGAEAAYVLDAQRRPGAVHRARLPRHRLPGAARRRRRRRCPALEHTIVLHLG